MVLASDLAAKSLCRERYSTAVWFSGVLLRGSPLAPPRHLWVSLAVLFQLCKLCTIARCWPSKICTEAERWQLASPLNIEVRGAAAQAVWCRSVWEQAVC